VTTQGNTITIEPASPEVVYVPAYDPWLVYGYPIVASQVGILCPESIMTARDFSSAPDLESAFSEDLDGAGTTGVGTGTTTE
jgi:hypothetical protein